MLQDPQSVAVGSTLDVTLPNLGLGNNGISDTITPQPLPANMTFNRGTGELVFAPAPDEAGTFSYAATFQTVGQPDGATLGLVAGDFQGSADGL
ncbi:MAG: hypothetical protein ACYC61_29695, partial [Isosphaeraceae bacterium]